MEISELVRSLLERRGVTESHDVHAFLTPDYAAHTHDPRLFAGIDVALERVFLALERDERIAVYADFDCDGIPGAALLSDLFTKIGYDNFEVYLPHRDREGYGFHQDAIGALAEARLPAGRQGVKLIITVDVGTTALDAVAFASTLGVDVIVTDHHEIPAPPVGGLPAAVAVLNPKLSPYPFPHLCGAAVAFKFAQALLAEGRARGIERFVSIPVGWEKWLLDLVAIATVADMVPLVGENRVLAYWGLTVLRRSKRPGISALCNALRLRKGDLTEDDIGFSFAPRINAASRMGEPDLALRLLTTRDAEEAEKLAAHLEELNASRKGVVGGIVREAKKRARERFNEKDTVVVLGDTEWKPALLGLAANSILESRRLPDGSQGVVCLWGRDVNGNIKGSCRSDGAVSVVELFRAADVFDEYGGHAASGGFSVSHEKVHTLPEILTEAITTLVRAERSMESCLHDPSRQRAAEADALVTLREISWSLYRDVSRLSPFGVGNVKPVFLIRGVKVVSVRQFGKEKNHVEVQLACGETGAAARGFQFFRTAEDFTLHPSNGATADVYATLERDTYRNALALRLVDIVPGT